MHRRVFCGLGLSLLLTGCGKTGSSPRADSAAASEAELANVLTELTQALRKYSAEKRQVPSSLNELVAAGYLRKLPNPPPGKAFSIDLKTLQVIVK